MARQVHPSQLSEFGLKKMVAEKLAQEINHALSTHSNEETWQIISTQLLSQEQPFSLHLFLFSLCYPNWQAHPDTAAAWIPDSNIAANTHLARWMRELNFKTLHEFHSWTISHNAEFWLTMIKKLEIVFKKKSDKLYDLNHGVTQPSWFPGAKFNIVDSCFNAPSSHTAIIYQKKAGAIQKITYQELHHLVNRIANSLVKLGFKPGDPIAIDMPMTIEAVAIYLGIIKMGGIVVSIADSFSKDEITTRLRIAKTKAIFTQDIISRDTKKLPLYEKVIAADAPIAIVLPCHDKIECLLREMDMTWQTFLIDDEKFESYSADPMSHCNILFSSGTTGDPKAIPWNHTTPIKSASDAFLHHNIQEQDVFAWPTNLGWMMGPWLIFATFINKATIALYDGAPREREFGQFIQDAKVTLLGVVPSLVSTWQQTQCMQGLDWQRIKLFTSTGECSNAEDMLYLMSLAGYKPVIEYCGGTEIGGAYISSTLIEKNYPSIFTTPAMGVDFVLLDDNGKLTDNGEVALIPPSIGLSTELLNAHHQQVYYADMPTLSDGKILRRHGDQAQRFSNGCYAILGRVDDTMNLGGIKISSVEIERALTGIKGITESAAIAVNFPQQGPSHLVIYAATQDALVKDEIIKIMQAKIREHLNPLFKIYDVVFLKELPKTASNKIMRRMLRQEYEISRKVEG